MAAWIMWVTPQHLYTRHSRSGGSHHGFAGDFLLWQLAYAEIYVTPTLWPEFRGVHLLEGIAEYQKRERRYGAVPAGGAAHPHASHQHASKTGRSWAGNYNY